MSGQAYINIKQLVNVRHESHVLHGKELENLPVIQNAFLIIEDGVIAEYGEMKNVQHSALKFHNQIDCTGQMILPCWCDSHTHIVFEGSRENEFVDKIKGLSYAEIAENGGGIVNSAAKLNAASEDEL